MRDVGACELPGFVRPGALGMFVEDARRVAPLAHRSGGLGTVYLNAQAMLAALTAGRDDLPSIRTVLDAGEPRNPYFRV